MVLVLNNDEVREVLDMKLCMEALEQAYKASALGQAVNRVKTHIYDRMKKSLETARAGKENYLAFIA